jgi:NAD(P)-dependent dehydrogenase (short-subunit alcohol dehydrogenase family)
LFDLTGRVVIVIGATKGIGRATATRMIEHSARVVVTSRAAEDAEARAAELNAEYGEGRAIGTRFDLLDRADGPKLIARAVSEWGRVDTLVCNAAHIALGRLESLGDDMELIDASFQANVRNYAALTRHVVPVMKAQGGGSIIYLSSTAGFIAAPPYLAYGLAKHALGYLARVLAVTYGADNIRFNAIVPGAIDTGTSALQKSGAHEIFVARIPLRRRGLPDEIAGMAVLLASPSGAYATGQCFILDGGQVIHGMEGITEGYDFAAGLWADDQNRAADARAYYAQASDDAVED